MNPRASFLLGLGLVAVGAVAGVAAVLLWQRAPAPEASSSGSGFLESNAEAATLPEQCGRGDANACANLGMSLEDTAPLDAAVRYQQACRLGSATGCNNWGTMLFEGQGIPRDRGQAADLFVKACGLKHKLACANLSAIYAGGLGVKRSRTLAAIYKKKACQLGDADSCD
jgi:hypothetical protein